MLKKLRGNAVFRLERLREYKFRASLAVLCRRHVSIRIVDKLHVCQSIVDTNFCCGDGLFYRQIVPINFF